MVQELGKIAVATACYAAAPPFFARGRCHMLIPVCIPSLRQIRARGHRPGRSTCPVSELGGGQRPPAVTVSPPHGDRLRGAVTACPTLVRRPTLVPSLPTRRTRNPATLPRRLANEPQTEPLHSAWHSAFHPLPTCHAFLPCPPDDHHHRHPLPIDAHHTTRLHRIRRDRILSSSSKRCSATCTTPPALLNDPTPTCDYHPSVRIPTASMTAASLSSQLKGPGPLPAASFLPHRCPRNRSPALDQLCALSLVTTRPDTDLR